MVMSTYIPMKTIIMVAEVRVVMVHLTIHICSSLVCYSVVAIMPGHLYNANNQGRICNVDLGHSGALLLF